MVDLTRRKLQLLYKEKVNFHVRKVMISEFVESDATYEQIAIASYVSTTLNKLLNKKLFVEDRKNDI